jgi:hypothetical protein
LIVNLEEGLKLSSKLRATPLHKFEKINEDGTSIGEKIFSEILKIYIDLNAEKPIKYAGPLALGDQLAIAISEIYKNNLLFEKYQPQISSINNLI